MSWSFWPLEVVAITEGVWIFIGAAVWSHSLLFILDYTSCFGMFPFHVKAIFEILIRHSTVGLAIYHENFISLEKTRLHPSAACVSLSIEVVCSLPFEFLAEPTISNFTFLRSSHAVGMNSVRLVKDAHIGIEHHLLRFIMI